MEMPGSKGVRGENLFNPVPGLMFREPCSRRALPVTAGGLEFAAPLA
jgi:hypothetical protein